MLNRISQIVTVDPPGAVDLSAYTIDQYLIDSHLTYSGVVEPGQGLPKLDGRAAASGVLFDRIEAATGPDLEFNQKKPLPNTFECSYSYFLTGLEFSPYVIPHKVWGFGFYKDPAASATPPYNVEFFPPVER